MNSHRDVSPGHFGGHKYSATIAAVQHTRLLALSVIDRVFVRSAKVVVETSPLAPGRITVVVI